MSEQDIRDRALRLLNQVEKLVPLLGGESLEQVRTRTKEVAHGIEVRFNAEEMGALEVVLGMVGFLLERSGAGADRAQVEKEKRALALLRRVLEDNR